MKYKEFLDSIQKKKPPAPSQAILDLEKRLQSKLPQDYRTFLTECNGGYVGGALWFKGSKSRGSSAEAGIHHIGGFREEYHFSLIEHIGTYEGRIPKSLLWIMDDPFGNAICIGISRPHTGKIYFWDHEEEPDPDLWDGTVETAGNIRLLANSFQAFLKGLARTDLE